MDMGNSPSHEEHYVMLLKCLLKGNGVHLREKEFTELLVLVNWHYFWFQATLPVHLKLIAWKQVFRALRKTHRECGIYQ